MGAAGARRSRSPPASTISRGIAITVEFARGYARHRLRGRGPIVCERLRHRHHGLCPATDAGTRRRVTWTVRAPQDGAATESWARMALRLPAHVLSALDFSSSYAYRSYTAVTPRST